MGPEQSRQANCGGEWQGLARWQTNQLVSAGEEAGPQVARRGHTWVGSRALIRCQQWHFLTMSIHKQASQQRCSVLGEWKKGPRRILQCSRQREEATYGCAHTPSHKDTHKDPFLSQSLSSHLYWSSSVAGLRWGSRSLSAEHHCQEFHRVNARVGNHSTRLCAVMECNRVHFILSSFSILLLYCS